MTSIRDHGVHLVSLSWKEQVFLMLCALSVNLINVSQTCSWGPQGVHVFAHYTANSINSYLHMTWLLSLGILRITALELQ